MFLLLAALIAGLANAQDVLETIEVKKDISEGLISSGAVKDAIIKTEVINKRKIERKQARNLIQAIENEPGIQTQNGDSLCGLKRVQINGLRGEYTTVLIDGIPLHSTVSSYYGFEALGTLGVANIEIARGSGSALVAPEAIGGVINVVTEKARDNKVIIDVSGGNQNYQNLNIAATSVGDEGRRRTTVAAQYAKTGQWDHDKNGISETPQRDNRSALIKYSQDLGSMTNIDLRLSTLKTNIFGGPMGKQTFETINTSAPDISNTDFRNGDVRKRFIGSPGSIAEIVNINRNEVATKLTQNVSENVNLSGTVSYAFANQDSWYEGQDYHNSDKTSFYDVKLNLVLSEGHLFTVGSDLKQETLRSNSQTFFSRPGIKKDNFNYSSPGLYLQDIWNASEKLEISSALRLNKVQNNWTSQTAKTNEIDETVFAPRVHLRYRHNEAVQSRLAYGRGYRAPLTFFESEHGILKDGFTVNINHLETADTFTYSLSRTGENTTATFSGSWARVKNISYIDSTGVVPLLTNYTKRSVEVGTLDGSLGYQWNRYFSTGLTYEKYFYQNLYKGLSPVANVEQRASFLMDYDLDRFDFSTTVNWVGARNLAPYNYKNRFNVFDGTNVSSPKRAHAPNFFTVDMQAVYKLTPSSSLTLGVRNLFDYVQTESPLYFSPNGDFDANYIWGPLIGRQFYAGVKSVF